MESQEERTRTPPPRTVFTNVGHVTPAGTDDGSVSVSDSEFEDMYEMLISDLMLFAMVNPRHRNPMMLLFRRLVAKGHTGLLPFLDEIGVLNSPTPANGSRGNWRLDPRVVTPIGNSPLS